MFFFSTYIVPSRPRIVRSSGSCVYPPYFLVASPLSSPSRWSLSTASSSFVRILSMSFCSPSWPVSSTCPSPTATVPSVVSSPASSFVLLEGSHSSEFPESSVTLGAMKSTACCIRTSRLKLCQCWSPLCLSSQDLMQRSWYLRRQIFLSGLMYWDVSRKRLTPMGIM